MRFVAAILGLCLASTAAEAALVVSKSPTSNVTCTDGVCTATAADAVLNVDELRALLAAGDVTLVSGAEARDIAIAANFALKGPRGLTLDAWRGITVTGSVGVNGRGPVTLITNDGGAEGNLTFSGKGRLDFRKTINELRINGNRYTLVADLHALAVAVRQDPSQRLALAHDVDASLDGTYDDAVVPREFGGVFEALGHAIDKLTILATAPKPGLGLFRAIGAEGTVRNLHLTAPSVRAADRDSEFCAGALASASAGKIRNVHVNGGTVFAAHNDRYPHQCAGGLVGLNTGTIDHAQVRLTRVNAAGHGGGLVVTNQGSIVSSSASQIDVNGWANSAVGGLAYANSGSIALSWVTGSLYAGDATGLGSTAAGGFVVFNTGTIDSSWTSALVDAGHGEEDGSNTAYGFGGGFVESNSGTISHVYALGDVLSNELSTATGFVFTNNAPGVIRQVYTLAKVGCGDTHCDGRYAFHFDGCPNGGADYWDTSYYKGSYDCTGLTGLTDAQLKAGLPDGFDPAIWGQAGGINNGYPYLIANPPR